MACLIQKRIVNPHYKKIAPDSHFRLYHEVHGQYPKNDYYVFVDCGRCINCFKKYMSSWRFRLLHEFYSLSPSQLKHTYYVTFTIEPKYYTTKKPLLKKMVRRFLERVRKHYKHSVRHFLVTERGDNGTHRFHFHGFLFDTDVNPAHLYQLWHYGFVSVYPVTSSQYEISQQVSYCTTYITKGKKGKLPDVIPPDEFPLILVSPGLGSSYVSYSRGLHTRGILFSQAYDFQGKLRSLPRYLRQKVFNESQLKFLKDDYFKNFSDDVLPEGPYFIGDRQYNDYSLYLKDAQKIKSKYYKYYVKQYSRALSSDVHS